MANRLTDTELQDVRDDISRLESRADELDAEAEGILEDMRDEGVNPLTDDEAYESYSDVAKRADAKRDKANELRDRFEDELQRRGRDNDRRRSVDTRDDQPEGETVGERFVQRDEYQQFADRVEDDAFDLRTLVNRGFPAAQVANRDEAKRYLQLRDVSSAALVENDRLGGITDPHDYRPVRVLDLISVGDTDSDTVEYVTEDAPTENVDDVAYGTDPATASTLPESTYGFSEKTVSTARMGHYVPATEKQLADAGQLRSLLDSRLRDGVRRDVERIVVKGDSGGGDPFDGILNTTGIGSVAVDTANNEPRHDAIYRAKTTVRVNTEGRVEPSVIGLHPNDMEELVLEKDSDGNYLNNRGVREPASIWGLRPVVSTIFPENTALVGDYRGANLWMRTGVNVAASTEHSDWFLKGWVAIKAQVRAAFGVTIARNFCEVTSF